jgi:ATP-dependent Clp protease, protease subunit
MFNPTFMYKNGDREYRESAQDILLAQRYVSFRHQFDDQTCSLMTDLLVVLDGKAQKDDLVGPESDIEVDLNSPGGVVTAGLGMINTMNNISCAVNITASGQACSMGSLWLLLATGKRRMTKDARVMIHKISGGAKGNMDSINITTEEMNKLNDFLSDQIFARFNPKKIKRSEFDLKLLKGDWFLNAEECLDYGIIDEIVQPKFVFDTKTRRMVKV